MTKFIERFLNFLAFLIFENRFRFWTRFYAYFDYGRAFRSRKSCRAVFISDPFKFKATCFSEKEFVSKSAQHAKHEYEFLPLSFQTTSRHAWFAICLIQYFNSCYSHDVFIWLFVEICRIIRKWIIYKVTYNLS